MNVLINKFLEICENDIHYSHQFFSFIQLVNEFSSISITLKIYSYEFKWENLCPIHFVFLCLLNLTIKL